MKINYDHGQWIDAHAHWADVRWAESLEFLFNDAAKAGVGFVLQGGVSPEDWDRQVMLKNKFKNFIGLCFGLHPYWVVENDDEQCELGLNQLVKYLPQAMALGETGLDFRPHIMKDSRERQLDLFENQLEIAIAAEKPVVLHVVQAHEEALKMVDLVGKNKKGGMVHSFNGSSKKAKDWVDRGFYLSIGGPVARKDNYKLHQAVKELPLEYLLIETDSPDQPPPEWNHEKNPPSSLIRVAEVIGHLKGVTSLEILDMTTSNFKRLFGV